MRIYANRVQYSRQYTYLYIVMIVLNLFLLGWAVVEADYSLGGQPPPTAARTSPRRVAAATPRPARPRADDQVKFWVFVLADSIVTFFVLVEIALNLCAQGESPPQRDIARRHG